MQVLGIVSEKVVIEELWDTKQKTGVDGLAFEYCINIGTIATQLLSKPLYSSALTMKLIFYNMTNMQIQF